jgi:hypothetical protein
MKVILPKSTQVDHAAPITYRQLAKRLVRAGISAEGYRRRFKLPLAYTDIMDAELGDEVVGYRALIGWYRQSRTPVRRVQQTQ